MSGEKDGRAWLERVRESSPLLSDYYQSRALDDAFRWGARLRTMLRQRREVSGLWLRGEAGSGRHTAAGFVLRELSAQNYEVCFLPGDGGARAAQDGLNDLLNECYDAGRPLCLVLDRTEEDYTAPYLALLGRVACEYWLGRESLPPLLLLIPDGPEATLPFLLRSRLYSVELTLPDRAARLRLFMGRGLDLKHSVDAETFAELTDGCSYAALVDLLRDARTTLDAEGAELLSARTLERLIRARRRDAELPPLWEAVLNRVEPLLRAIPQPPAPVVQPIPAAEQSVPEDAQRRAYETMPVKDLLAQLLDAETAAQIAAHERGGRRLNQQQETR